MTGIFINYRTDDAGFAAALVYQKLVEVFGKDRVFRDAGSLEPGRDFTEQLWRRLEESSVVLALIGPDWLTLQTNDGRRRIDDPDDFVRRELTRAFELKIRVIPVLLNSTILPGPDDLPDPLRQLTTRQFVHLRGRNDDMDIKYLVGVLKRSVPVSTADGGERTAAGADLSVPPSRHGGTVFNGAGTVVHGDVVAGDKYGSDR